jgi:hypothetical protein
MCAKFIKCDDSNEYKCNICSDNIEKDKIIGLKCNPQKHIFCYDCIFDWFKVLKKKHGSAYYSTLNMCPMCRKNGGLLPTCDGYDVIKNIHDFKVVPINDSKNLINPNKLEHECGFKLLNGNGYCKLVGKYEGLCGKHVSKKDLLPKENSSVITNKDNNLISILKEILDINPEKLEYECGMKFKSKNGYCKMKCKEEYGGFCYIHRITKKSLKSSNDTSITNDNNVLIL